MKVGFLVRNTTMPARDVLQLKKDVGSKQRLFYVEKTTCAHWPMNWKNNLSRGVAFELPNLRVGSVIFVLKTSLGYSDETLCANKNKFELLPSKTIHPTSLFPCRYKSRRLSALKEHSAVELNVNYFIHLLWHSEKKHAYSLGNYS